MECWEFFEEFSHEDTWHDTIGKIVFRSVEGETVNFFVEKLNEYITHKCTQKRKLEFKKKNFLKKKVALWTSFGTKLTKN